MLNQDYEDLYNFSLSNVEQFWDEIAKEVIWNKPYTNVIEDKFSHSPKWFVRGEINMSYNCLDKHVEDGYGDDIAVIHESPITGSTRLITYKQLLESVALLAGVMVDRCHIQKGDIVLLYFPLIPEGLISMLACTRIGATYIVVYGGFSTKELAARILYTNPKMILTCNAGPEPGHIINYKEKIDSALEINKLTPPFCLVYNRPNFKCASIQKDIDLDWTSELYNAKPHGPVPLESNHPIFIIFTSGTTEELKGLVHSTGNTVVYNKYSAKYILKFHSKETLWTFSDFGWILGQSQMTYGALMLRMSTILYEGKVVGTPNNKQFARVLNWHKVSLIICPPTIMRILESTCSESDLELNYNGLHSIFIGGESSDKHLRNWISKTFKCPVYNGWGSTELGGIVTLSTHIWRNKLNPISDSSMIQMPGIDVRVVDRKTGREEPRRTLGRMVLKLPTIPSLATTIFKNHERFVRTYFQRYPGYFDTMDAGIIEENGLFKIEARDDDIIHVMSSRICGTAVEEACLNNKEIREAAVIALEDKIKGYVPFAFLVPRLHVNISERDIIDRAISSVVDIIGEVTCFNKAIIVSEIPITLNGKVHRHSLKCMIHGEEFKMPVTVVNTYVYSEIYDVLRKAGYNASLPL